MMAIDYYRHNTIKYSITCILNNAVYPVHSNYSSNFVKFPIWAPPTNLIMLLIKTTRCSYKKGNNFNLMKSINVEKKVLFAGARLLQKKKIIVAQNNWKFFCIHNSYLWHHKTICCLWHTIGIFLLNIHNIVA